MTTRSSGQSEERMLQQLREILLREEREELRRLSDILDSPDTLAQRVIPLIDEKLIFLQQHFPKEYERVVQKIVERSIEQSQGELLNTLYPVLGKMIRKYIQHEFELLRERIDETISQSFFGRLRASLFGVKESDLVLSQLSDSTIEEVYVIQRGSGILIGSASRQEMLDKDVIAGMLTAIKSFVEDAFQRGQEDLEIIQYETYQIFIQNFHSYYIALAINGTLSASQKDKLAEEVLTFAEKELKQLVRTMDRATNLRIKKKLEQYFMTPQGKGKTVPFTPALSSGEKVIKSSKSLKA